jgi:hypothetical protein
MDLTSLSSNLPRNNPPNPDDLPEDEEPSSTILMSAFKQAAYSVTTLYKMAGEQVERARRDGQKEGYQECLDDLFALLQRLDGKGDPATREIFKQWALGKRRKLGNRATRRDEREPSSESDIVERQRSSSPVQQQQPPQQLHTDPEPAEQMHISSPSRQSLPPATHSPPLLPHLSTFNFSAAHHMPRHVRPQPETSDLELPDNDSPPTSPRITPQQNIFQHNSFQQTKTFGGNNPNGSRRHSRPRAGNKRRYESIDDFFGLAGMEKMHMGKKGRFQ